MNTLGIDVNDDDIDFGDEDPNSMPYSSPYDDLAFEMYVDTEVADIIRQMEIKKHQAVKSKTTPNITSSFLITLNIFR